MGRSAGSLSSTTRESSADLLVGGTTLTALASETEIEKSAADKENEDSSIRHGDVGFDDDTGIQFPKKRVWNGCIPIPKRRKKGIGMPSQKNSKTYIAYKEAMATAPPPPLININNDNEPPATSIDTVDNEDPTPAISPTALLHPSQLLRKLASKDNTINRERKMRKRAEEKVAALQEELKRIKNEMHRDRKVSRQL